mmetsp:Transcript_73106/g.136650  ORF Transcript_73106/g.136650 Transcript_73106/m.136650 type:complete len:357 (+) Transcript_73106:80-1150(+)
MADGMSAKFMKNAFVGWTMSAGTYYPPDFDASKLMPVKHLRPKGINAEMRNIRMMFPFTMICDHCGEYNYTGTKFTAKCEPIKSEAYLGLKVYRFYGHCKHCWSEFTFKTDPKNSDYSMESGGRRTYEAWKDADMAETQLKAEKALAAEQDAMKALEQKSIDVQAEIQRIEDLDAIRQLNKRNGKSSTIEDALDWLFKQKEVEEKEELEAKERLSGGELKELKAFMREREEFKRRKLNDSADQEQQGGKLEDAVDQGAGATKSSASSSAAADGQSVAAPSSQAAIRDAAIAAAVASRASEKKPAIGGRPLTISVKRKQPVDAASTTTASVASDAAKENNIENSGMGLLGGYDSSDE